MGIRFSCPSGHKLHVKEFLAGKRGVCPHCGAKFQIPAAQEEPGNRSGSGDALTASGIAAVSDTASHSVIISVTDEPRGATVKKHKSSPPDQSTEPAPSASTADAIVLPPPPSINPADIPSSSPTIRYPSRRERLRRKQLTSAIVLLIAVIVLALLLIWVLQSGTAQTSAAKIYRSGWSSRGYSPPAARPVWEKAHVTRTALL
jgi:hypothetical protein